MLPVYGDGLQMRNWLHVPDHRTAFAAVLTGHITMPVAAGSQGKLVMMSTLW